MTPNDPETFVQRILDVLGTEEGSIIVRGPDKWVALPPGPIGYVLVIGDGGVPEWRDPATVPFAVAS